MKPDRSNFPVTHDDEYQNALLGDIGLATRTNPGIPLKSLFPDLADNNNDNEKETCPTVKGKSSEWDPLGFLFNIFRAA